MKILLIEFDVSFLNKCIVWKFYKYFIVMIVENENKCDEVYMCVEVKVMFGVMFVYFMCGI